MSAVSGARVIFLCKFQKNEQITVLGSVYIAEVNLLFYFTQCAILHFGVMLHLVIVCDSLTHSLIETGDWQFCMFDSSHEHEF